MTQPNVSLGFWVNANCVDAKRTACLALAWATRWARLIVTLSHFGGFL
jgi:hypothetical protein